MSYRAVLQDEQTSEWVLCQDRFATHGEANSQGRAFWRAFWPLMRTWLVVEAIEPVDAIGLADDASCRMVMAKPGQETLRNIGLHLVTGGPDVTMPEGGC